MARAAIPWRKIEASAKKMFVQPIYESYWVEKPTRYNELKAPTTVYDRTSGNYAVIGYNVMVVRDQFTGFSKGRLFPQYKRIRNVVFIRI